MDRTAGHLDGGRSKPGWAGDFFSTLKVGSFEVGLAEGLNAWLVGRRVRGIGILG